MRVLIFGTVYCDTPEKARMVEYWQQLHRHINPQCDLLLVDSASPVSLPFFDNRVVLQLNDNIGHLARGGQDGWGRAFCAGLTYAEVCEYDYVAHIEGDSLFRLPVLSICGQMLADGIECASVPVRGTKNIERNWIETGLMVLDASIIGDVVDLYDWTNCELKRKYPHCPEWHMERIVGPYLRMMPWSAERGDRGQITIHNVDNYDWITHVSPEVATAFMRSAA